MSLFDLGGRVAIVTGSSRGIGRAIAMGLAQAGAKVVISSRKAPACEAVAAEIAKAGGTAISLPCNIGHKDQLEALVAETRKRLGAIDILVCNAAVNPYYGPLAEIPDDAFDRIMASNVRSNLWLCRMVQPDMAAKREGSIIIISSIAAVKGTPTLGAYAISKAADFQLARNLAVEWGRHNIRVNCIAPGLVKTDFARALWENQELLQRTIAATPLGRIGDPEDMTGLAVFLASPAAAFITGQAIIADGGVTVTGAV
ncbi:MAG TPA: SDR family oxidoreductase [Stellaceae bacterium]|nr:SDR family oxidoreductase [Stellaceae bacterium]